MNYTTTKNQLFALRGTAIVLAFSMVIGLLFWGPIAQWASYHDFADKRSFCSISNFSNVVSNLSFLVAGVYLFLNRGVLSQNATIKTINAAAALSLCSLFLGSVWYHLMPNDARLVWDRLPIASFFSLLFLKVLLDLGIVRSSTVTPSVGGILRKNKAFCLAFLYWIGSCTSVFIWSWTGDLRIYAAAQFYPLVCILAFLIILSLEKSSRLYAKGLFILIFSYALAKVAESMDYPILVFTDGFMSGHTVKHIIAGCGILLFFMFQKRNTQVEFSGS